VPGVNVALEQQGCCQYFLKVRWRLPEQVQCDLIWRCLPHPPLCTSLYMADPYVVTLGASTALRAVPRRRPLEEYTPQRSVWMCLYQAETHLMYRVFKVRHGARGRYPLEEQHGSQQYL